jgi:hypothetical protein
LVIVLFFVSALKIFPFVEMRSIVQVSILLVVTCQLADGVSSVQISQNKPVQKLIVSVHFVVRQSCHIRINGLYVSATNLCEPHLHHGKAG